MGWAYDVLKVFEKRNDVFVARHTKTQIHSRDLFLVMLCGKFVGSRLYFRKQRIPGHTSIGCAMVFQNGIQGAGEKTAFAILV